MDGGSVVDTGRGWANMTRSLDWRPVGVGDFNDDGRDDMLLRRADGAWRYYAMDGRRVIAGDSGPANLPQSLDWRMAGVGDFDGDGRVDVLLRHVEGSWQLHPMQGRSVGPGRTANPDFTGDRAWRFIAIGDFNADGRDDVLLRHTSGRWRWQTGAGNTVASHAAAMPRDWRWRIAAVGDLDRDGSDDVLLRHVDGRWRTFTALGGAATAATPGMPRDLAWRIAAPPVYIPDTALRAAVKSALGVSAEDPVTRRALSELEVLQADGAGISDVTGLGLATSLRELSLNAASYDIPHGTAVIGDIGELACLVRLGRLSLANRGLTDISPLSSLAGLDFLELSVNRIEDIGPLAGLSRLRTLLMYHNQVADLAPLAGLERLHTLSLDANAIADIAPLSGLSRLHSLSLPWNEIEDVSPLAALTELTSLRLDSNRITDVSPLGQLENLRYLDLGRNDISTASPLSELTDLWFLSLNANRLTELSPLRKLTKMSWLRLNNNAISDIAPLSDMGHLTRLFLESNAIIDISPLATFTKLEQLTLDNNAITDIGALANLTALTELGLARNRVADISALRDLGEVRRLDLSGNEIVDIATLEFLTELEELDLSYNRIADIAPLAANTGLGDGDEIDLRGNPISLESAETAIPVLVARGAAVQVPRAPRQYAIHDDRVLVFPVDEDIAAQTAFSGLSLRDYAAEFYTSFEDQFDFLMFFSNLDSIRDHEEAPYYGVYLSVRNDVEGTGRREHYDNRYGSRERLKGVIHFPYNRALMYGPSLHEILHAWANYAVPTAVGGHWGFSSANGQLGGFDLPDLRQIGEGKYAAGRFGTFANGGNGPGYSPIELYFAGYLPPEEVPDLWVAQDGHWEIGEDGKPIRTEDDHLVFRSQDERTYTIDEIVALHGERLPAMADAQWHYRAAVILLTDERHPPTQEQLDLLSEHAAWFSLRANDDSRLHNFFEATRGRGSITLDGLATARKEVVGVPNGLPASYGQVPPAHASLVDGTCVTVDLSGERVARTTTISSDFVIHNN